MSSRVYSSYLLRLWLVSGSAAQDDTQPSSESLVLQVQNLQTGVTWRLNSLAELNELMASVILEGHLANSEDKSLSANQDKGRPLLKTEQDIQE